MGFFATFWAWLNGQMATYVGDNTARLAAILEPALVTLATVYVMAWGYLNLTGKIEEPFRDGLKRILLLALILGTGLHLWLYNTVIVDTFYNAPAQLAAAVVGAADPGSNHRYDLGARGRGRRQSMGARQRASIRVGLWHRGRGGLVLHGTAVRVLDVSDRTL